MKVEGGIGGLYYHIITRRIAGNTAIKGLEMPAQWRTICLVYISANPNASQKNEDPKFPRTIFSSPKKM
jgi:hypothetical protein